MKCEGDQLVALSHVCSISPSEVKLLTIESGGRVKSDDFLWLYSGQLLFIPPVAIFTSSSLDSGKHSLYFVVEMDMNGKLDANEYYYDFAEINVEK